MVRGASYTQEKRKKKPSASGDDIRKLIIFAGRHRLDRKRSVARANPTLSATWVRRLSACAKLRPVARDETVKIIRNALRTEPS